MQSTGWKTKAVLFYIVSTPTDKHRVRSSTPEQDKNCSSSPMGWAINKPEYGDKMKLCKTNQLSKPGLRQ